MLEMIIVMERTISMMMIILDVADKGAYAYDKNDEYGDYDDSFHNINDFMRMGMKMRIIFIMILRILMMMIILLV